MAGVPYVIVEGGYELRVTFTPRAHRSRRWFWTACDLEDRSRLCSGRAVSDEDAIRDARAAAGELRDEAGELAA